MPKELRISAVIEIPDDIWRQTDALAAVKPAVESFAAAVQAAGGRVDAELVTPKPRADKGDAAQQYAALGGGLPA